MEFFKTIGVATANFFDEYGAGFAMLVLAGLIIAGIVEVGVKKAFAWLEEKIGDKPYLSIARMATIFAVTIIGTLVSTALILNGDLPLPGNKVLAPFWFAVIYLAQYIFSMHGFKAIFRIKDREKPEKPAKEPKPKKVSPVEGMKKIAFNVYKDEQGNLYNRKGEKL